VGGFPVRLVVAEAQAAAAAVKAAAAALLLHLDKVITAVLVTLVPTGMAVAEVVLMLLVKPVVPIALTFGLMAQSLVAVTVAVAVLPQFQALLSPVAVAGVVHMDM
jgi:hypothetical protein